MQIFAYPQALIRLCMSFAGAILKAIFIEHDLYHPVLIVVYKQSNNGTQVILLESFLGHCTMHLGKLTLNIY